jgi:hypothetical protein
MGYHEHNHRRSHPINRDRGMAATPWIAAAIGAVVVSALLFWGFMNAGINAGTTSPSSAQTTGSGGPTPKAPAPASK